MNRKILTVAVIAAVLFTLVFAGCELFDGPPVRDNLNDPYAEGLDYEVEMEFNSFIDSISIELKLTGTAPYDDDNDVYFQLYYGTDAEMEGDGNDSIAVDGYNVYLDNLLGGTTYNFWLACFDNETEEMLFMKYDTCTTEAYGTYDDDFGNGGRKSIDDFYAITSGFTYDVISDSSNNIYVAASAESTTNLIFKLNDYGGLESSFGSAGIFFDNDTVVDQHMAMMSEDLLSFQDSGTIEELDYFMNDYGTNTVGSFMYQPEVAVGTDDYMFVAGMDGASRFSVKRFESDMTTTNSLEYFIETSDILSEPNYGIVSDINYENSRIYSVGWLEDIYATRFVNAVILGSDDLGEDYTIEFDANWDSSSNRIRQVGTTGEVVGPQIAADTDNNVYIAGVGILTKFSENGNIYDTEPDWPNYDGAYGSGHVFFGDNFCPVELIVQENGKILLFGNFWTDMEMTEAIIDKGVIYRFDTEGDYDDSFNGGGMFEIDNVEITGAELKSDGRIVFTTNEGSAGAVYQLE